jgi:hypothetical protein
VVLEWVQVLAVTKVDACLANNNNRLQALVKASVQQEALEAMLQHIQLVKPSTKIFHRHQESTNLDKLEALDRVHRDSAEIRDSEEPREADFKEVNNNQQVLVEVITSKYHLTRQRQLSTITISQKQKCFLERRILMHKALSSI